MNYNYSNKLLTFCMLSLTLLFGQGGNAQTYATVPYSTGFESGALDASWLTSVTPGPGAVSVVQTGTVTWNGLTAVSNTGNYFLGMPLGSSANVVNTSQADLFLDLAGQSNVDLNFFWADFNDETNTEDGIYISDNNGVTFIKVLDFYPGDSTDLDYTYFNLNLDSINTANGIIFTSTYIVRFQQYDNFFFGGGDGFMFDDIEVVNVVCTSTAASIDPIVCDTYTVPSGDETYLTSGVYSDTILNVEGCDSVITINLTINNSTTSSIVETACNTYLAPDGTSYNTSGIYTAIISTSSGCDSTITIDLTVNNGTTSSIVETVCDTYLAPDGTSYSTSGMYTAVIPNTSSCDSTITIDLTVNTFTTSVTDTTAVTSYTAPSGTVYTNSGTYFDTIPNAAGCDSVITINLTVSSIGIGELDNIEFAVYPNPSSDFMRLQFEKESIQIQKIQIYDMSGKLIMTSLYTDKIIDVSNLSNGLFTLVISHSKGLARTLFSKSSN